MPTEIILTCCKVDANYQVKDANNEIIFAAVNQREVLARAFTFGKEKNADKVTILKEDGSLLKEKHFLPQSKLKIRKKKYPKRVVMNIDLIK